MRLRRSFGVLTEESVALLLELEQHHPHLVQSIGEVLARERDQALAMQHRLEQERTRQISALRRQVEALGYPEVEALDIDGGVASWRRYLLSPPEDLEPVVAEVARLAEKIKTIRVELYLRVENNSK